MRRRQAVGRWQSAVALVTTTWTLGRVALVCVALGGMTVGCVSGAPDTEPPKELMKYVVDDVPKGLTQLDANFAGKITLVGVKVSPSTEVAPGKRVKLQMYWRVNEPLGESGWKLFTHVLDASGDRLMNIDNVGPLRHVRRNEQALAPSRWVKGKVYVDTQSFTMPRKVRSATVQVVTGIWKGKRRQKLVSGPSAGQDRALVVTLETGKSRSTRTRVPRLEVARLPEGQRPRIDGKLDDEAWSHATATGDFVNVSTGKADSKSPVQGKARLAWDDTSLYVAFEVKDQKVVGGFDPKAKDPHLWTKDCVELMIDPDGDGDNKDYYEIQLSPQGLVFDSRFDGYNTPKKEPNGPFGHEDWSAQLESAVHVDGTLDDDSDRDEGYVIEARIPWASFAKARRSPPGPGDSWRVNLYAMKNNGGVAWSPILRQGNFHKASRFGRITWVDEPSRTGPTASAGSVASKPSVSKAGLRAAPKKKGEVAVP